GNPIMSVGDQRLEQRCHDSIGRGAIRLINASPGEGINTRPHPHINRTTLIASGISTMPIYRSDWTLSNKPAH
ncbi:MAG: hypothetical protein R3175_05460, partial [Marinobacter sp.]|uniref:hypothetical protein n=1 Tax=Marinobacter sp. TaxID=50741 RepID=UPI00299EEAD1